MQNNPQLPPHFITVEDAIALIQQDKRDDATVDLKFLVDNIPYLEKKHNYNIRLMKTLPNGEAVRNGSVYVQLNSEYEAQILLHAIVEAYKARTNIAIKEDAVGVNRVSTVVDEEHDVMDARPRPNTLSETKIGEDISRGYDKVVEGA